MMNQIPNTRQSPATLSDKDTAIFDLLTRLWRDDPSEPLLHALQHSDKFPAIRRRVKQTLCTLRPERVAWSTLHHSWSTRKSSAPLSSMSPHLLERDERITSLDNPGFIDKPGQNQDFFTEQHTWSN
ncbi:hypothetical protein BLNAU_2454 [Blattamonas nauphoetae]|uniref:Uncharacterized protein n=1 Tax=Blattamonas nauphoetae TaxID=2049346 RepID=A0ABQ9YFS8_9EUKA|nr:hypothetical protein BLNAU_19273 [Blattamonas nauphoetae]KAK2962621.1 hypothetical protein BLNAU_2454 [Blattamonas nauphoetae]